MDFFTGILKMTRLDEDAGEHIERFINNFTGKHYIKEAWQRLALCNLMKGDTTLYFQQLANCKTQGAALMDADRQAMKDAELKTLPNVNLLKARFLNDGGYTNRALTILNQMDTAQLSTHHKIEWLYRNAKVCQTAGDNDKAQYFYNATINTSPNNELYFGAKSCLQLGHMYASSKQLVIEKNKSLKKYNTFNIEAQAAYFTNIQQTTDLVELLLYPIYKKHPHLIIGGGSNILLTKNFDGLVIHNQIKGIEVTHQSEDYVWVEFGAGEIWHNCVLHCIKNNWAGIENLSLIPGYVGAAPMQNIGAYGVELKDVFEALHAVNLQTGETIKNKLKNQYLITKVILRLNKTPHTHHFNISYGAIEKTLEERGVKELSIKAISDAVIKIRQNKLPDPKVIGNAGSFFKNPVIDNSLAQSIKKQYPNMPSYPNNKLTKIPAGWLIDQCGWKGKVIGETGTYKNQALVLINRGEARGSEIFDLSEKIKQSVKEQFGIALKREVNVV